MVTAANNIKAQVTEWQADEQTDRQTANLELFAHLTAEIKPRWIHESYSFSRLSGINKFINEDIKSIDKPLAAWT